MSEAEISNILTNDPKYKANLKHGEKLEGADDKAYKKALTYLHTGNLEGMKEFGAKGAMSDNTAIALDNMFKANDLLPYPPGAKNPGTVMSLYNYSEGKLITSSEGIRTTNLPDGTTKLEYVTVKHQEKQNTTAEVIRAKGLRNPVISPSESEADIRKVGDVIQKRISGRTVAETEALFGSYANKSARAIASKDIPPLTTVGQPNNGVQPAVAARGSAEKPESPPSRLADSADSRPKLSTKELLQRDQKFRGNLAYGSGLSGSVVERLSDSDLARLSASQRTWLLDRSDYAIYKKALTCLTTGDLDGMNEFSAGGKYPMSNRTGMALDKMFKSNGLIPYMPGGKNSGVTVMALNDKITTK